MQKWILAALGASLYALGGHATQNDDLAPSYSAWPQSAEEALGLYYELIPDSDLPLAPAGPELPDEQETISTILLASCLDEEKQQAPALTSMIGENADLLLMLGDNVYGDRDGRSYVVNQPNLDELRQSFADLAARDDFKALRSSVPIMPVWDDHDYGANDSGQEFPFKVLAERIHERFWGLNEEDVGHWPGVYYARHFGPEGQRVQIIMLDTRFFRSELTMTDDYGAPGKERYLPAPPDTMQDMLGAAQWAWLENQLQKPADIRLIVSSIQIMPTVHGWESWSRLPVERQHLFDLIRRTKATGVIFLSGDRHTAFIYEQPDLLPYTANELTASSLNVSFTGKSDEMDARQVGAAYTPENYGAVSIDWGGRTVSLQIKNANGETVNANRVSFTEIGVSD